jgi:hypothetical protein
MDLNNFCRLNKFFNPTLCSGIGENKTSNMTQEELMRKRVIVENKWPGCQYEVGDMLYKHGVGFYYCLVGESRLINSGQVEPFPYLMRPLNWWEERDEKDMPKYVRDNDGNVYLADWKKDKNYPMKMILREAHGELQCAEYFVTHKVMCFFEPATESEYQSYISNQKQAT